MIRKLLSGGLLTIAIFSLVFVSCNDDDDFDSSIIPEFPEFPTSISSAPGYEFVFEGLITDGIGIETVDMQYPDWYLEKFIVFEDAPKEYLLKYKFMVPENEDKESSHTIKVSVTNIAGNKTTHDVIVTLDQDVTSPEIEILAPLTGSAIAKGDNVSLQVNFTDDKSLDSIFVLNEEFGLDMKIKMEEGTTSYLLDGSFDVPSDAVDGTHIIEIRAVDKAGNVNNAISAVIVGEKNEITQMFVVGGSMWWEWDVSKSSKMWKDPENEDVFILEFYYWTGYGIKFVGQLDWAPNNWGLDPNDESKMINSEDSKEINFPDGDGYYRVKFNPYLLEYTYEIITVDIDVKNEMYIVGNGYPDYPNLDWNPEAAIKMDADPWGNPYVFTAWVQISDDTSLKFIGQNDGWSPYDCGFEEGGEIIFPVNYAKNKVGDGSSDIKFKGQAGWYYITFDYFLLRTTIHYYE